jgi:hypothetical protein
MNIAEKTILGIAVLSLVFLVFSAFFFSPEQGSTLELVMLLPILPIK